MLRHGLYELKIGRKYVVPNVPIMEHYALEAVTPLPNQALDLFPYLFVCLCVFWNRERISKNDHKLRPY